jgi:hypothetical protein
LKKDCGEPGCRNDHRSQVLSRGDELNNGVTSAVDAVDGSSTGT